MERWQIDLIDVRQFKDENKGHTFIINIIDCFSKFMWARPLITKSADEVIKNIEAVIFLNGPPEIIHTDNGKEFINSLMTALAPKWRLKLKNGRPRHPQSQGQVERANQTLCRSLAKKLHSTPKVNCLDIIDETVYEYNTCVHRANNASPFMILLKRTGWNHIAQIEEEAEEEDENNRDLESRNENDEDENENNIVRLSTFLNFNESKDKEEIQKEALSNFGNPFKNQKIEIANLKTPKRTLADRIKEVETNPNFSSEFQDIDNFYATENVGSSISIKKNMPISDKKIELPTKAKPLSKKSKVKSKVNSMSDRILSIENEPCFFKDFKDIEDLYDNLDVGSSKNAKDIEFKDDDDYEMDEDENLLLLKAKKFLAFRTKYQQKLIDDQSVHLRKISFLKGDTVMVKRDADNNTTTRQGKLQSFYSYNGIICNVLQNNKFEICLFNKSKITCNHSQLKKFHPYSEKIDTIPDGNCGFSAIGLAVKKSQFQVRQDFVEHIDQNITELSQLFNLIVWKEVRKKVFRTENNICGFENWMPVPECIILCSRVYK